MHSPEKKYLTFDTYIPFLLQPHLCVFSCKIHKTLKSVLEIILNFLLKVPFFKSTEKKKKSLTKNPEIGPVYIVTTQ